MKKAFHYPDRTGDLTGRVFEPYTRDGAHYCAVGYVEAGSLRVMSHSEYDDAIARYDRLHDRFQAQYRREIRWDSLSSHQRGTIPDPRRVLDGEERAAYEEALAQAGLTRTDRHAAAVRDACFNDGNGRLEAVFDVAGRAIFESQMTPAVLAYSMGMLTLGDAKRLVQSKGWGKPMPARPMRSAPL